MAGESVPRQKGGEDGFEFSLDWRSAAPSSGLSALDIPVVAFPGASPQAAMKPGLWP